MKWNEMKGKEMKGKEMKWNEVYRYIQTTARMTICTDTRDYIDSILELLFPAECTCGGV